MKKIAFLIFVLWGLLMPLFSISPIKIATYITGDIDSAYKTIIGNRIVSYMSSNNKYIVVERTSEFQNIIGKEHSFQRTGIVDDQQIVELGKQFGVRYVLGVNATKLFDEIYLVIKQLDIFSGEILNTVDVSAKISNKEDLQKLTVNACDYLTYDYSKVSISKEINSAEDFWQLSTPKGYHMATIDEIKFLINAYIATGRRFKNPIVTDVESGAFSKLDKNYNQCTITFKIIRKDLSIEEDLVSYVVHRREHYVYPCKTDEIYYVYYIKNHQD